MHNHTCDGPLCNGARNSEIEFDRDRKTGKRLIYCRRCVRRLQEEAKPSPPGAPQPRPAGSEATKRCTACGRELPLGAYPWHNRAADGHYNICRNCYSRRQAAAQVRRAPQTPGKAKPPAPRAARPARKKDHPAGQASRRASPGAAGEPAIALTVSGAASLMDIAAGRPEAIRQLITAARRQALSALQKHLQATARQLQ